MLIGAMNHPGRNVIEELTWMAGMELDFIDLTLEPPAAASWRVNAKDIRRALDDLGRILGDLFLFDAVLAIASAGGEQGNGYNENKSLHGILVL